MLSFVRWVDRGCIEAALCVRPGANAFGHLSGRKTRVTDSPQSSSPPPVELSLERLRDVLTVVVLLAAVAVAYLPFLDAPFVFDDHFDIVADASLRQLWPATWLHGKRPLTTLTFALCWAFSPNAVEGFRAVNVAIHAGASLLCWGLAARVLALPRLSALTAPAWLAPLVALLWALHPLQTSAVTYVVHRYESLAGLFYLATVYCFIRGSSSPKRWRWYLFSLAACLLGGLSKETLITVPLVCLLLDLTLVESSVRRLLAARWLYYIGLGLCLLPMLVMAVWMPVAASQKAGEGTGPLQYLLSQPSALAHYARLVVWPWPLCIDYYDWPVVTSLRQWRWREILVLCGVVTTLVGLARRRLWALPLGLALLILLPTSSIIPLRHELVAERRLYLPLLPLLAGALLGANRLVSRPVRLLPGAGIAVALLWLGMTLMRNLQFSSQIGLYEAEVQHRPRNARAAIWHARYLADRARLVEADAESRRAFALDPTVPRIERQMNRIASLTGDLVRARQFAELGLLRDPKNPESYQLAIDANVRAGDVARAVALLETAVKRRPREPEWRDMLAWYLATEPSLRDGPRALKLVDQALALPWKRSRERALQTRAAALAACGRTDEARLVIEELRRAALQQGHGRDAAWLEQQRRVYAEGRPWDRTSVALPSGPGDDSPASPAQ